MHTAPSSTELLLTVAEPTRLRILNCLAAAPLFVSDLQVVLGLPQPTVSRHLQVLRRVELVRDTPIAQFVLYRLRRDLWISFADLVGDHAEDDRARMARVAHWVRIDAARELRRHYGLNCGLRAAAGRLFRG